MTLFSDHVTVFPDHVLKIEPRLIQISNSSFITLMMLIVPSRQVPFLK